jgi:hypothetical protein
MHVLGLGLLAGGQRIIGGAALACATLLFLVNMSRVLVHLRSGKSPASLAPKPAPLSL